jgi:hypothetical protein
MKILCTMPGRTGDVLWSLPAARMISRHFSTPVDFAVSKKYGSEGLLKLIAAQPYIGKAFAIQSWEVVESAPMSPRIPPEIPQTYDQEYHLGYAGWPEGTLAGDVWARCCAAIPALAGTPLDLSPWITNFAIPAMPPRNIFVGWSEEWIELKMGVTVAIAGGIPNEWQFDIVHGVGARHGEWWKLDRFFNFYSCDLFTAASLLARSVFYLGCLSSTWVLANAMGKRCVVVEPAEARWHPVFWREDEKNRLVVGGGHPTFDARHAVDEVKEMIKRCGY